MKGMMGEVCLNMASDGARGTLSEVCRQLAEASALERCVGEGASEELAAMWILMEKLNRVQRQLLNGMRAAWGVR